jgi:hypothetical protein
LVHVIFTFLASEILMASVTHMEFETSALQTQIVRTEVSNSAIAFAWLIDEDGNEGARYDLKFEFGKWAAVRTLAERSEDAARVALGHHSRSEPTNDLVISLKCNDSTHRAPFRIIRRF